MAGNFNIFDNAPSAGVLLLLSILLTGNCVPVNSDADEDFATRTRELMNSSVDPCEDFYQYACGNYKNVETINSGNDYKTVANEIYLNVQKKVMDILKSPVKRKEKKSSERKIKELFQSCTNTTARNKYLGKPFLEEVVAVLGGWDLLHTWNETEWDLNTALKKATTDLSTPSLYHLFGRNPNQVYQSAFTTDEISVTEGAAGQYMQNFWYLSDITTQKSHYETFMREVVSLLMRDAGQPCDTEEEMAKIDQFVDDVITIETEIVRISENSRYFFREIPKITLDNLTVESKHVINWVEQISYMVNDATINGSNEVKIWSLEYIQNITNMIVELQHTNRKRILHNYLIWRVAETYIEDLSSEYIDALTKLKRQLSPDPYFKELTQSCFDQIKTYMPHALEAEFISEYFSSAAKEEVRAFMEHMNTVLQDELDGISWMDKETKANAKEKLKGLSFQVGYPDWMTNTESVDNLYNALEVNDASYFRNHLNINKFATSLLFGKVLPMEVSQSWRNTLVFNTFMRYQLHRNKIVAPAGSLQYPWYDQAQSHFGSLSGRVGKLLYDAVGEAGSHYDKSGNALDRSWWGPLTHVAYEQRRECLYDVYAADTTTTMSSNPNVTAPPRNYALWYYTHTAIATIDGIRLALKAYRKWVSERNIIEKKLPGLILTNDQMVFLSYVQSSCYGFSRDSAYISKEDFNLNTAMSQLTEFSDAFDCKATAKLNSVPKCNNFEATPQPN